jgi:hypothetical protein
LAWLRRDLQAFFPFPQMKQVDYLHLEGMSCLTFHEDMRRTLRKVLTPTEIPTFTWPRGSLTKDPLMVALKPLFQGGIEKCRLTTIGSLVGTYVHDLKLNSPPTVFHWDDELAL